MELAYIFKTLLERKLALVPIVIVAFAVAILSAYHVSGSGLKPRSEQYGAATQQVLIDSPQSALVDLKKDTGPLSVRASVYAQFMRSTAIVDGIASRLHILRAQITTQGPFNSVGASQNISQPAVSRSSEIAAEREVYRLAFDAQENLPVITIYAQAPDADKAFALSNAAVASLQKYVDDLQTKEALKPADRVTVRPLGAPSGGTVNHGSRKAVMVLIFLVIVAVGCVGIIGWASFRRSWRQLNAADEADTAAQTTWPDGTPATPVSLAPRVEPDPGPGPERELVVEHHREHIR
jgi:flagellar basal body-associated protein FliL